MLVAPAILTPANREFSRILLECGAASGLKLCLDAGDAKSYDGNGSTWYDRSGTACDFNMGNGGLNKPTFQPGAWYGGRSPLNYMLYDGAAWNSVASAPAWMQNLHKANALWGILTWTYLGATAAGSQEIFGTWNAPASWGSIGIQCSVLSSDSTWNLALNGSVGGALAVASFTRPPGKWDCWGWSIDANNGSFEFLNGAFVSGNAYSSPSASSYDGVPFIGVSNGDAGTALTNGSRIGGIFIWEGRQPSRNDFMTIYEATRKRYRV